MSQNFCHVCLECETHIAEQRKQKNEFERTENNCIKTPHCDLIIELIFKGNYMQELLRK